MTKPILTGKVAVQVYTALVEEARQGRHEALDGLYLMLGDDMKSAIENQRSIINRLELIQRALEEMTDLQIHAAAKLINEGNSK